MTPVDVGFFVLVGSFREALVVALGTTLSWWFFSDYYIGPEYPWWTEWMDRYAFLFASAIFVAFYVVLRTRLIRHRFRPLRSTPGLVDESTPLSPETWRRMLSVMAEQPQMRGARGYLRWLDEGLAGLRPDKAILPPRIARCWLRSRAGARLLAAAWYPALSVALIFVPTHTNITEWLAVRWLGDQGTVFAVIGEGVSETTREGVQDSLRYQDNQWTRQASAEVSYGQVSVRTTAFPRVVRTLQVTCPVVNHGCDVGLLNAPRGATESVLSLPIRVGQSAFQFRQSDANDRNLNMQLVLLRRDGKVLDKAFIEPR